MESGPASRFGAQRAFAFFLLLGISVLFFAVIRPFLVTLLLAGVFSALAHPLYRRLLPMLKGRPVAASAITIVITLVVVVLPLVGLVSMVTAEAVEISQRAQPWLRENIRQQTDLETHLLARFPILEQVMPYRPQILSRLGEAASAAGSYLVSSLSAAARGTALFLFHLFLMLYAVFYFLIDGETLVDRLGRLLPLTEADRRRLLDRFVSVSRATLKGTLLIALVQGVLSGAAFWVAGVKGAAFWGALVVVAAMVPGIGTALVWGPAVLYLILTGRLLAGLLLLGWCAGVVGTVDNVLRPKLVGRDTQMSSPMILFSTLGGLLLFGASGLIIGPIVAGLFVTAWEMYGSILRDGQPQADPARTPAGGVASPPDAGAPPQGA